MPSGPRRAGPAQPKVRRDRLPNPRGSAYAPAAARRRRGVFADASGRAPRSRTARRPAVLRQGGGSSNTLHERHLRTMAADGQCWAGSSSAIRPSVSGAGQVVEAPRHAGMRRLSAAFRIVEESAGSCSTVPPPRGAGQPRPGQHRVRAGPRPAARVGAPPRARPRLYDALRDFKATWSDPSTAASGRRPGRACGLQRAATSVAGGGDVDRGGPGPGDQVSAWRRSRRNWSATAWARPRSRRRTSKVPPIICHGCSNMASMLPSTSRSWSRSSPRHTGSWSASAATPGVRAARRTVQLRHKRAPPVVAPR